MQSGTDSSANESGNQGTNNPELPEAPEERVFGRATITDVAHVAGVSVATVSKVVNGRYGVAAATAARVLNVVADLGYESSLVARSLRRQRTNVIGVLVAEFEPFSTELLKGISTAAKGTGYELLAYCGDTEATNVGWERRSLSRLAGTLIDGVVIVTPTLALPVNEDVPLVAVDPHTGPSGLATVDSDNRSGARTATEHLITLGHTRIGYIGGRRDLESARQRELGFYEAMRAARLTPDPSLVVEGGYHPDVSDRPTHELLERPDRPTAVFAANDLSAIHVMHVAQELGLSVPHDLSVIGFDDIPEAAGATPPLTTIAQSLQEMGAESLRMVIAMLTSDNTAAQHIRLPTHLITRASTAPPPA